MPSFDVFKGAEDGLPKKNTLSKPDELVGDQVLVRIMASGLCGTGEHITQKPPHEPRLTIYLRFALC